MRYKSSKLAYDGSDQLIYIGKHYRVSADDGLSDHWLMKLTWTDGKVTAIQEGEGSWTDRATVFP